MTAAAPKFHWEPIRWLSHHVGEPIDYDTQCCECLHPIHRGELARSTGYGVKHDKCPKFAATCPSCFLQHNGECL